MHNGSSGFSCMNAVFASACALEGQRSMQHEAAPSHTIITSGMEQVRRTNECELHGAFRVDQEEVLHFRDF